MKKSDKDIKDNLSTDKVYELAVLTLHHIENKIETINKFYFSAFAALILALPFILDFSVRFSQTSKKYDKFTLLEEINIVLFMLMAFWYGQIRPERKRLETLKSALLQIESNYSNGFLSYKSGKKMPLVKDTGWRGVTVWLPFCIWLLTTFLYSYLLKNS